MKEDIGILWEQRSKVYGTRPEGVLPKSFPGPVNNYLHNWMFGRIKETIPKNKKVRILDLGCAYGRLSSEILKEFPKAHTFGVDVSHHYISLYNESLNPRGKATVGDIRNLPFGDDSFDIVFMVTTLMYVIKKEDQERVMKEIFRILKPKGKFVVIERNPIGYALITLGGLVGKLRGKKFQEITSVSFRKTYMSFLIREGGGSIDHYRGLPAWTLFLPFSVLLSKVNTGLLKKILNVIRPLDVRVSWLLTLSLYISYSGVKR